MPQNKQKQQNKLQGIGNQKSTATQQAYVNDESKTIHGGAKDTEPNTKENQLR
jgi:hypothetical protein